MQPPSKIGCPESQSVASPSRIDIAAPAPRPVAVPGPELSIAVVDRDSDQRILVSNALRAQKSGTVSQFACCAQGAAETAWMLSQGYDMVLVGLDSDPDSMLQMIEALCGTSAVAVIAYGSQVDQDLLMRAMRAGAREFLPLPLSPISLRASLDRISRRLKLAPRAQTRENGSIFVFAGAKGGAGVTSIAVQYALAMAAQAGRRAVLLDLNIPLGDASLLLGLESNYSSADALADEQRLDTTYLDSLLVRHASGLQLLAAPTQFLYCPPTEAAIDRLLTLSAQENDFVIVDAGLALNPALNLLFERAARIYLVSQVDVSSLRNANRLMHSIFEPSRSKVEVILNHYHSREALLGEDAIVRALTMPPAWRIPNDPRGLVRLQNQATPISALDGPFAQTILRMASRATGLEPAPAKKSVFSLFR